LRIDIHHWFAMVAILNPKWPPKYKNLPIWAKFGFWKPNFAQFGGFLYLAAILYLGYHGNGCHFEFFSTLKSCHILRRIFISIVGLLWWPF
jgi:hypothetical protein